MNNNELEEFLAKFSTEKLLGIITVKANSYNERFHDFAKDELIKRNVKFDFSPILIQEAAALSNNDLKVLVEWKYNDYHLEYMEIARDEYLKRGLKNEAQEDARVDASLFKETKYSTLHLLSNIYYGVGWVFIISIGITVLVAMYASGSDLSFFTLLLYIVVEVFGAIMSFGSAEMIKLFIDIESNTRK